MQQTAPRYIVHLYIYSWLIMAVRTALPPGHHAALMKMGTLGKAFAAASAAVLVIGVVVVVTRLCCSRTACFVDQWLVRGPPVRLHDWLGPPF